MIGRYRSAEKSAFASARLLSEKSASQCSAREEVSYEFGFVAVSWLQESYSPTFRIFAASSLFLFVQSLISNILLLSTQLLFPQLP